MTNIEKESKQTTTEKVLDLLKEFASESSLWKEPKDITENSSFVKDIGMDSIDRYEFFYRVEENLGLTLPDRMVGYFENAGDYGDYIDSNKQ